MVRGLRASIFAFTAALVLAPSAGAITNGQPDDGRHPYVGALVSHDGKDRKHRLICSGTLLSPTIFLTASHCLKNEPSNLYVSFDAFVGAPTVDTSKVTLHPGTGIPHPSFTDETAPGDTHDIAVVRLDPPVGGIEPARLPQLGAIRPDLRFELVGYGQEGRDGTRAIGGGGRRYAFGAFGSLQDFKLRLDQTGTTGGTCNGDSGGPVLRGSTTTVLGVTSDGDADCTEHGIYYRVDTPSAREFLDDFVTFPAPNAPGAPVAPGHGRSETAQLVHARLLKGFAVSRRGTRIRRLGVDQLPAGAAVTMRCLPRRHCPFSARRVTGRTSVGLRGAFRSRRLRPGTVVTITVSAPGALTRTIRLTVTRTRVRITGA